MTIGRFPRIGVAGVVQELVDEVPGFAVGDGFADLVGADAVPFAEGCRERLAVLVVEPGEGDYFSSTSWLSFWKISKYLLAMSIIEGLAVRGISRRLPFLRFFDEAGELVDAGDVAFADFVDVFEADAQWQVDDGAVGETAVEVVVADGVLAFRGLGDLLERGFFLFGRPAVEVDFGDAGGFGLGCHVGCLSVVVDGVSGLVGSPAATRLRCGRRLPSGCCHGDGCCGAGHLVDGRGDFGCARLDEGERAAADRGDGLVQ